MTQNGYAIQQLNQKYEDYSSLKKLLSHFNNRIEYRREVPQTTADAAAALEEVSGETIDAMAASKVLNVGQKTDQVGTDGGETGKITWADILGNKTDATFTMSAVDSSTRVAVVAPVTTARFIESFSIDNLDAADEILLSNAAGSEIFAVIKVGQHQCIKSGFLAGLGRRSFIGRVKVHLSVVTAVVTLVATYYPLGSVQAVTKSFLTNSIDLTWEPCIELEPATKVTWTIEDDNAAHPVATVDIDYIEAWN